MRIVHINSVDYGSTGNIAKAICLFSNCNGIKSILCVPNSRMNKKMANNNVRVYGSRLLRRLSSFIEKITGNHNALNYYNTYRLISVIKGYKPSIVHIHNIHDSFLNQKMLFKYLNKERIDVVWTFHDCWPITGRCPYFSTKQCVNWKSGCNNCSFEKTMYPATCRKKEDILWERKKNIFLSIKKLWICCPSLWLFNIVKQSFFSNATIMVINNWIDLSIFNPLGPKYEFSNVSNDDFIILGVAFGWDYRKGLDAFISLSQIIPENYHIVLVGTNDIIDHSLPSNIISIHRTTDVLELVRIYNASNVFFNPTREEVFGLVNIEALACGLPVVTFDTDGSPECIDDKTGFVVDKDDIDGALSKIRLICEQKIIKKDDCIKRAQLFEKSLKIGEYITLYETILKEK